MSTGTLPTPTAALPGDVSMPLVGLGTWQMRGHECTNAVRWALEAGYRHLDTATMYGNEREVGEALRASGVPRDDVFVTTKLPPNHVGQERRTLEESLQALGTDHVDLWLVHWPPEAGAGVATWEEFVRVREEGLARAIGVSNYALDQVDQLTTVTGVTPAVNQVKWSPLLFDRGLLDGLRSRGVVPEGYSPFKGGSLDSPVVRETAERHGVTPGQVVVRWHRQHEVVVIPKSAQQERIVANADVDGFTLDDAEMAALDALGRTTR